MAVEEPVLASHQDGAQQPSPLKLEDAELLSSSTDTDAPTQPAIDVGILAEQSHVDLELERQEDCDERTRTSIECDKDLVVTASDEQLATPTGYVTVDEGDDADVAPPIVQDATRASDDVTSAKILHRARQAAASMLQQQQLQLVQRIDDFEDSLVSSTDVSRSYSVVSEGSDISLPSVELYDESNDSSMSSLIIGTSVDDPAQDDLARDAIPTPGAETPEADIDDSRLQVVVHYDESLQSILASKLRDQTHPYPPFKGSARRCGPHAFNEACISCVSTVSRRRRMGGTRHGASSSTWTATTSSGSR